MKAIAIREPGGPEVLQPIETEKPSPESHEVLIEVAAAGVNRPDCLQRAGLYPVPDGASPLPGLEVAGHIVEVGAQCSRFNVGDRVMALTHGGGYAEFCVADERHCLPVPKSMTLEAAAAFPETAFTVWSNLWMRAGLTSGERLLVHGGSSGIGTTAIQIAKALGVEVAVTAGTDEKCAFCLALGADIAVNSIDHRVTRRRNRRTGEPCQDSPQPPHSFRYHTETPIKRSEGCYRRRTGNSGPATPRVGRGETGNIRITAA